jgi:hypothetical protein
VEHDGGLGFAAVERSRLHLEQVTDVDVPCGDDANASGPGDEGSEGVEMGFMPVGDDDDELGDALGFPGGEELVERPVQSFVRESGGTRVPSLGSYIDAVVHGGSTQNILFPGQVEGEFACNEYIGAERQMGTVLLESADRDNEARVAREVRRDIDPAQLIESEGRFWRM